MVTSSTVQTSGVAGELSVDLNDLKMEKENKDDIQIYSNPAKYLFNITKLTEGLYLCGACAIRADSFETLGITCVINCTTREELPDPPLPDMVTTYLRVPVLDSPTTDLSPFFHNITSTIKKIIQDGQKVLVHCIAGVSRSASFCLAFLLRYHNMSLKDAYNYIERRRPCIKPNNTFFKQLIEFEVAHRGVPSVSMILDSATRSHIPDIYECKFTDRWCCQLKLCQKRHCGMH